MTRNRSMRMSAISCLAICLVSLILRPVQGAQESVDERLTAEPGGLILVKSTRGRVSVVGWDRSEVHVEGTLDEQIEEFIFEIRGDVTRLEVVLPEHMEHRILQRTTDLTIHMPAGSALEISGVSLGVDVDAVSRQLAIGVISGNIDVRDCRGQIELQTISGRIGLRGADGRISLRSVSGDLVAQNMTGEARLSTVSGQMNVEGGADLNLESVSGDIDILGVEVPQLRGQTVSGEIRFEGSLSLNASVDLSTISGKIGVELSGEMGGTWDLQSGTGRIRNEMTSDLPEKTPYGSGQSLRFRAGDTGRQVNISTRSGQVTLSRP